MSNLQINNCSQCELKNGVIIGLIADIRLYKTRNNELQAENKRLNDKDGLYDEVKELQEELVTANDGINDLNDVLKDLQAENNAVKQCYEGSKVKVKVLQVDNDRLIKQVSSNRDSNSNTHTHTISGEIAEYMSHNDKCMGARMFLIPRDEFKHGEYDNTIYWDDGIE